MSRELIECHYCGSYNPVDDYGFVMCDCGGRFAWRKKTCGECGYSRKYGKNDKRFCRKHTWGIDNADTFGFGEVLINDSACPDFVAKEPTNG